MIYSNTYQHFIWVNIYTTGGDNAWWWSSKLSNHILTKVLLRVPESLVWPESRDTSQCHSLLFKVSSLNRVNSTIRNNTVALQLTNNYIKTLAYIKMIVLVLLLRYLFYLSKDAAHSAVYCQNSWNRHGTQWTSH